MSYGPALPEHLQKKREQEEEEDEDEDEDEEDSYGPALPPGMARKKNRDTDDEVEEKKKKDVLGPRLPPGMEMRKDEEEVESSDDDGEVVGPMPPKPGEQQGTSASVAALEIERRSRIMLDKIEGRGKVEEPQRETWMLELPAEKEKNFGLGARTFSRSKAEPRKKGEAKQAWTDTPEMKAKRERGELAEEEVVPDPTQDKDVLDYLAGLKRDEEMEKVTKVLKEKRGSETLMDKHAKKLAKKAKKEEEKGTVQERRPFDRDVDLQANRFDNAAKQSMIKRAQQIDNRFSSGENKFL
jgi:hypothetical protein